MYFLSPYQDPHHHTVSINTQECALWFERFEDTSTVT